jgi:hypothetical protein
MKKIIHESLFKIRKYFLHQVWESADASLLLTSKLNVDRVKRLRNIETLSDVEFKVYSQWGEDGIIQYLTHRIPIENKCFIEFGVENYTEANTRFLIVNDNWKGLVIDGSEDQVNNIKSDDIYWKYDLTAQCWFITRDNINDIIKNAGFDGDIGLLSIDIDGNDYWIWDAIDMVSPRIVICEYNSIFGSEFPISVPYEKDFVRTTAHYSNLYFGASLPALCLLAEKKGYDFVGTNSVGSNAFFVRKDFSQGIKKLSAKEGYIKSNIRESRDNNGQLSYLTGRDRLQAISHLDVVNVSSGSHMKLRDIIEK